MRRAGFTLVEILVVLTIMGTLLALGTLRFNLFITKGAIERQTRELYSDFMAVRTAAVTQHTSKTVVITPTTVTFVAGELSGGTTTKTLSKPITWTGKASSDTQKVIVFDEHGTFNIYSSALANTTICVEPSVENAQVDSIILFSTRIHLGKVYFVGIQGDCKSGNVTVN